MNWAQVNEASMQDCIEWIAVNELVSKLLNEWMTQKGKELSECEWIKESVNDWTSEYELSKWLTEWKNDSESEWT